MLALYRCDRQADALQAYQDGRRTLTEDLGIEPGERLRELERSILAQDPVLAVAARETAELPPDLGAETLLAGRDAELDWLREHWRRARGGAGRLVLVTGTTGMGKTRLAAELAVEVHRDRCEVRYVAGGARRMPHAQCLRARATPDRRCCLCSTTSTARAWSCAPRWARSSTDWRRCQCSWWRRPRIRRSRRHRARAHCWCSVRSRRPRWTPWCGYTRGRWMTGRSRSSGWLRRAVVSRGACIGPPASGRIGRRRGAWASRPSGRRANARACARPRTIWPATWRGCRRCGNARRSSTVKWR